MGLGRTPRTIAAECTYSGAIASGASRFHGREPRGPREHPEFRGSLLPFAVLISEPDRMDDRLSPSASLIGYRLALALSGKLGDECTVDSVV